MPIKELTADGRVELDLDQMAKQPGWSFDATDSRQAPVDRPGAGHP